MYLSCNYRPHPHTEIATFIVAGHETSSSGIAWCLHCLSNNIEAQELLRDEIRGLGTDSPDMEQIKSLKYLDYVVREGLRLYPPIPSTSRVAMKDDIIPLSNGTGIRCVHEAGPGLIRFVIDQLLSGLPRETGCLSLSLP